MSVWSSTYDYQAVFEGIVGKSFRGDIAIDDVKFLDGKCPPAGSAFLLNLEGEQFRTDRTTDYK